MRYSLANYLLSLKSENGEINEIIGSVTIGGEGSAVGLISVEYNESLWSTTGFPTGGYVHNKNLSKTGQITVSINQLSDKVAKFIQLCNISYGGNDDSLTISISDNDANQIICSAIDCYITKIPNQEFGASASEQSWVFTCGKITLGF